MQYVVRRLLALIPTVIGVTAIVFLSIHFIPGDIARVYLGTQATEEAIAQFTKRYGLDRPLSVQYFEWLGRVLRGDFGKSITTGVDIRKSLLLRFPLNLELTVFAIIVVVAVGLPLGIAAAVGRETGRGQLANSIGLVGISIPNFWLATMFVLLFAVRLGWFPSGGYVPFHENPLQNLKLMLLPSLSLGLISAAVILRFTRSTLLEVLGADYIRTARAKGLAERWVVYRHALRNALIPVITAVGMEFGYIFGGAFVIEVIFSLPGLGSYVILAVSARDFPPLQAGVLVIAAMFLGINLAVDLLYGVLDPRIRLAGRRG